MNRMFQVLAAAWFCWICGPGETEGRGFGGFGGFAGGRSFSSGFSDRSYGGSWGGQRSFEGFADRGFGGFQSSASHYGDWDGAGHSVSYSGSHTASGYSGYRGWGATSSYDHTWDGSHGGSINTDGTRGAFGTPWAGGYGATRNTSVTGPQGRTYDGSSQHGGVWGPSGSAWGGQHSSTATGFDGRTYSGSTAGGVAVGPYGRTIGGAEHTGSGTGPAGSFNNSWEKAFSGYHFPTDVGLSHYTAAGGAVAHSTTFWSAGAMTTRAAAVRTNFPYYNAFHPAWYTAHPGAWYAAGWRAGTAWTATPYASLVPFLGIPSPPVSYDYGDNVLIQDNNVYVDGQQTSSASDYGQQVINQAAQGQQANPPPEQEWKPLGVFSLVAGNDQTSNNVFQLAVNQDGIIRGNYYDGVMDTTTPVFGTVVKETQRAAWTIGKKTDRTFEAGLFNLTQSQCPVLLHVGPSRTEQMLLVRLPPEK